MVMRDILVAEAASDAGIRATPHPSPAIVCGLILRVGHKVDLVRGPDEGTRQAKYPLVGRFSFEKEIYREPLAPFPTLPSPNKTTDFIPLKLGGQEQVGVKGKKDRRS